MVIETNAVTVGGCDYELGRIPMLLVLIVLLRALFVHQPSTLKLSS